MWVYIVLLSIYPVWCQHTVSGCFVFRAYSAASRHKAAQRFWWWWAPPRRWPRRAASGKSAPVGGDGRTTQRCHSGHNSILSTPNDRHPHQPKKKKKNEAALTKTSCQWVRNDSARPLEAEIQRLWRGWQRRGCFSTCPQTGRSKQNQQKQDFFFPPVRPFPKISFLSAAMRAKAFLSSSSPPWP